MNITVEELEGVDYNYVHNGFTVYINEQRILTIMTPCVLTSTKWLRSVQKSYRNKRRPLIVGLCVDRENLNYTKRGLKDTPYDLMALCVGSHCLIFEMPDEGYGLPKPFKDLLSDPSTITVGMEIEKITKKLEKDYRFKISNPKDLRSLAQEGLPRDDLDLGRYGLDQLAKVVLGNHMDVIRPSEKIKWRDYHYHWMLTSEKVKYTTVDAYLCFEIGSKLLKMIDNTSSSSSSKK